MSIISKYFFKNVCKVISISCIVLAIPISCSKEDNSSNQLVPLEIKNAKCSGNPSTIALDIRNPNKVEVGADIYCSVLGSDDVTARKVLKTIKSGATLKDEFTVCSVADESCKFNQSTILCTISFKSPASKANPYPYPEHQVSDLVQLRCL